MVCVHLHADKLVVSVNVIELKRSQEQWKVSYPNYYNRWCGVIIKAHVQYTVIIQL